MAIGLEKVGCRHQYECALHKEEDRDIYEIACIALVQVICFLHVPCVTHSGRDPIRKTRFQIDHTVSKSARYGGFDFWHYVLRKKNPIALLYSGESTDV